VTSDVEASHARRRPEWVVGIGGSAGSLDGIEQFIAAAGLKMGVAFVIVTHLEPGHKTLLAEFVQRTTAMPVRDVHDGMKLAADTVFVIAPDRVLELERDVLRLRPIPRSQPHMVIDTFFQSLAHARHGRAIGVILSGTGEDGARGLAEIHDCGGTAMVQTPQTAAFDSMPRAALAAVPGAVVAPPDELPAQVAVLCGETGLVGGPSLARVLEAMRRRCGHDLSRYKPSTIVRRVERRVAALRLASFDAYADHVDANPGEMDLLFRELLIGVTQFFRDPDTWAVLHDVVLPVTIAAKRAPTTFRAWIAGCSTGEEAYSLAIVAHEALQAAGVTRVDVMVFATDIDESAIAIARAGLYPHRIAEFVTPERLRQFFSEEESGFRVRKQLRDSVVFAQQDLITDPPFTRLDVVSCRNVLIYMQAPLQREVLDRFHYALEPGGTLVLGTSETAPPQLFGRVDARANVFRKLGATRTRLVPSPVHGTPGSKPSVVEAAARMIVDTVAPLTVVINEHGDILYCSRRTGRYLEPAVGGANLNVFAMAREGLGPHLAFAVRQARSRRRRVHVDAIAIRGERGRTVVDLTVIPMNQPASLRGLLFVIFAETPTSAKRGKAAKSSRKLPTTIGHELARTRQQLQTVVREMEATQAHGEATSEELQSANEELQSANEELTTSKEELQSLNEELMTLNVELEAKNDELATANDDLRNLLDSTRVPTLFLDNRLRIKRFTSEATRVVNLIAGDVGRAITDITMKVDYEGIAQDVAEVLETLVFKEVQLNAADGTSYTMRIHPYRTMSNAIDGVVITFSDVTALRRAESALAARVHDTVIARLLDRWPGMVYVHDLVLGRDTYLNARARERLQNAGPGTSFESLVHAADTAEPARWLERIEQLRDDDVLTRRVRLRSRDGTYEMFHARVSVLARSAAGAPTRLLAVVEPMPLADR
jgi:two-component system CheB/CheR fusion protein